MGGRALKNTNTRRYEASEFHKLSCVIVSKISGILPDCRVTAVPAYRTKPSFGDLDIVIENIDAKNRLSNEFERLGVTEVVKNSNVWSLGGFDALQVDLIFVPSDEFDFSLCYFSWNDCGNLLGRIAKNMGFKLGQKGFFFTFREDNYLVDILLTSSFEQALHFMGYCPKRYKQGFNTLAEIFEYICSTPYFDSQCFLFQNRNHQDRKRDSKRPVYMAFLEFIEKRATVDSDTDKTMHLQRAFSQFSKFEHEVQCVKDRYNKHKQVKAIFNGRVIADLTGLSGRALGQFIILLKSDFATQAEFEDAILSQQRQAIDDWIVRRHERNCTAR